MLMEEKEKIRQLIRELVVFREDLNDLEKTFSRLNNEYNELYIKLNGMLDAD